MRLTIGKGHKNGDKPWHSNAPQESLNHNQGSMLVDEPNQTI